MYKLFLGELEHLFFKVGKLEFSYEITNGEKSNDNEVELRYFFREDQEVYSVFNEDEHIGYITVDTKEDLDKFSSIWNEFLDENFSSLYMFLLSLNRKRESRGIVISPDMLKSVVGIKITDALAEEFSIKVFGDLPIEQMALTSIDEAFLINARNQQEVAIMADSMFDKVISLESLNENKSYDKFQKNFFRGKSYKRR